MGVRREPTSLEIAGRWDRLRQAIERVELSLPIQMSENIEALRRERHSFEDLIMGRTTTPPKGSNHE